jgi:hypothetical protein
MTRSARCLPKWQGDRAWSMSYSPSGGQRLYGTRPSERVRFVRASCLSEERSGRWRRSRAAWRWRACSAANWSEVAQKLLASGQPWPAARALLLGFGLAIEPVTMDDAELAARLWDTGSNLSLADRLCLGSAPTFSPATSNGRADPESFWSASSTSTARTREELCTDFSLARSVRA